MVPLQSHKRYPSDQKLLHPATHSLLRQPLPSSFFCRPRPFTPPTSSSCSSLCHFSGAHPLVTSLTPPTPPSMLIQWRALVLVLGLALTSFQSAMAVQGPRDNSCSFGYNNTYYILGGTFFNASNFLSAPLPFSQDGVIAWTALPDPPQWVVMAAVDSTPQFHCAVNRDGKVFLFGNAVGFAVYDISSHLWSTPIPTYKSSISSANLLNQQGLNAAVHPDGYTISILATTPPTYMELDSQAMTIDGLAVQGFTQNLHGFCMDVVATSPPTPVVCGGSTSAVYSGACWQLGLGSASASVPFANLPTQDGCSLMAYGTKFMVIPGYLQTYHTTLPTATAINPDMQSYDLSSQSKAWTTISNAQQANPLPVRVYNSANIMPGTGVAVVFGGYNPGVNAVYGNIYFLDMSTGQWVNTINPASNPFPTPPSPSASGSAPTTSTSGGSTVPSHASTSSSSSSTAAIAGGVVGSIAVVGLAVGIFVYQRRKTRYDPALNNPEVISMDEPLNKTRSDLNSSPDSAYSWGQSGAQPRNPQFVVAPHPSSPQSISGPAPHGSAVVSGPHANFFP